MHFNLTYNPIRATIHTLLEIVVLEIVVTAVL